MPRSRSRSPREDERRRSRSPLSRPRVNERDHPRKNYGNFRWKDNRRDNFRSKARNDNSGLARGYRDRGERARSPPRGQYERGDRNREQGDGRYSQSSRHDIEKNTEGGRERKPTVKKPAAQPTEPLIVVHVNDRLGTKASIPCLPSDPIKLFKAQVAARIGREPHEILLKRQGERPFKDALTLEDYSISNGSQLDLEVDTGD